MIDAAASLLLDNTEGHAVLSQIRHHCKEQSKDNECKLTTLNRTLTRVRERVMQQYTPDLRALEPYQNQTEVHRFLSKPLADQVAIQRSNPPEWETDAKAALQSVQLQPASMVTFRLSEAERFEFSKMQLRQLETKNATLFVVTRGDEILQLITEMLSKTHGNLQSIILPLLLATGRRMTEILSPRSKFEPGPTPYHAVFTGQLKKHNADDATSYLIPLLVPYETLDAAIVALRKRQKCDGLTNDQIKQRYQGSLRREFRKCLPFMPAGTTNHSLRGLYCEFVYNAFEVPCSKNWLIQHVLGHENLATSLRYGSFRADGISHGQFGPLLLDT